MKTSFGYQQNENGMSSDEDDFSSSGSKPKSRASAQFQDDGQGMGDVIEVMNQLYDVNNQISMGGKNNASRIMLPQVVVLGAQSSGKTSVLESMSGEEVLPKGTDIQTRCPIVMQLIYTKDEPKHVEFLHLEGQKFTNMNDVKAEIEKINKKIIDSDQIVSEEPITLKLYSPSVTNLTLVDLPGLVATSMDDQPSDLVNKIQELVLKYIRNENCIILAISDANVDFSRSNSIQFAKIVDPNGKRTLGVLTKLDMMDKGTNANDVLLGKKLKLELGIVGVVNRSYLDVQEGKSLQDQLKKEQQFLESNYPSLASTNGTPYLIKRISGLLMRSIQKTLPSIKNEIEQLIDEQQQILEDLGEPEVLEDADKKVILLRLLTRFVESYCAQVDGRRRNLELNSLSASALIKKLFDQKLGDEFDNLVAANRFSDEEIDIAIHNSHALHSIHIDYDDTFQELAKREITKLKPYVTKCNKEVCMQMRHAIDTSCDTKITTQYPRLYQKIKQTATELINERFKDCQKYLDDYLNAEASIARTIRGGFRDKNGGYDNQTVGGNGSASVKLNGSSSSKNANASNQNGEKAPTQNGQSTNNITYENADTHRANVRSHVELYFDGAKRQIMEHVAKGIVYKLVYGTSDRMSEFMLMRIYGPENADKLLVDANFDAVQERRRATEQLLYDYEHASNVIDLILGKVDKLSK